MAERLKDIAKKIMQEKSRLPLIDISSESDINMVEDMPYEEPSKPESAIKNAMKNRGSYAKGSSKLEISTIKQSPSKNIKITKYYSSKFPLYDKKGNELVSLKNRQR